MLKLEGVDAFYGDLQALHQVSLDIQAGEIMALVGANAAGKTTTLRVISGTLRARAGGKPVPSRLAETDEVFRIAAALKEAGRGIVQVPEGRRLFPFLTVRENLLLGAHVAEARARSPRTLEYVFTLFPALADRTSQLAGSLPGGEQQMCAIGRALMARPRLLMLDEPTLGIAPVLVQKIFETVAAINRDGMTVLLVEQNVRRALALAYPTDFDFLPDGRLVLAGPARELLADERLKRAYLGL